MLTRYRMPDQNDHPVEGGAPRSARTPVRIGVVGAGFMGQLAHIANYAEVEGCHIVALADLRSDLRRRVAERHRIPRTYSTHWELLEDREVEAVVVVTPRPALGPIVLDCLRARKHVLSEKPMAASVAQAACLAEAARASEVLYAVGYMRRHDEGVQRAKALLKGFLDTGELGSVTLVRVHCFQGEGYCGISGHIVTDETAGVSGVEWPIAPEWVAEDERADYARFLNVYCHNVNLVRYLLEANPVVLFARLDRRGHGVSVFETARADVVLEFGRLSAHRWDDVTEIYFEHGRLRIECPPALLRNVPARVELYRGGEHPETRIPECGWTWAFRRQAEAFVHDVRERREPLASGLDAVADIQCIETMWQMARAVR